jgi:ribosomal protein S18 acetylase RimI-like enzyme
MVVTKNLEGISLKTLSETFNQAFGDYQLTLNLSEQQLGNNLNRYGYEPSASIGLFDGSRLVGFVCNGIRHNQAYDCGTAIIPSYRGKGYSHLLIEKARETLKLKKIDFWILEVLSENTRAKKLYQDKGFLFQRNFNCYSLGQAQEKREGSVSLAREETPLLEENPDCKPSWQNSNESVQAGSIEVWSILSEGKKAGYLCFSPETGSIAQLFVYPSFRHKGIATGAITAARNFSQSKTLRFINIDASYEPLNKFLRQYGFTLLTKQEEFVLDLDSN